MNKKTLLMGTLAVAVMLTTKIVRADYISDAAEMLNNKEVELQKLKENFSKDEVKKIENKAKELKLENLKKQKELEEEQQEAEKEKKLQEIINKNQKQKQKAKENILIEDLNKTLTNVKSDVDTLKRKVSNLEQKQTSTKSSDSNSKKIKLGNTSNSSSNSKKISKKEAVDLIIRGKLGDGDTRKESLKKLGFKEAEIKEIQKEVNKIIETDHIKVNLD